MSQHDFNIANQSASSARADINNALVALASQSSGATEPSTTYANMPWYDTSTTTLKMRSESDDAWISLGYLDQSSNTFKLFDDTHLVNSGGTQTGLLGDQATSVWQTGTGTTESLVSPAKVKAAFDAQYTGNAPVFWVRAWCRWDGTGSTGTITPLGSGNIGTLTKNNSGRFSVTFATPMPDANYAITYSGGNTLSNSNLVQLTMDYNNVTASGFSFSISDATNNSYQSAINNSFTVVR